MPLDLARRMFQNNNSIFQCFFAKGKNGIKGESGVKDASTGGGGGYRRYPSLSDIKLQYNPDLKLAPGTMMTIYKCPVDSCNKRSCTDMKSFKLHCLHIHQVMNNLGKKYLMLK